MMTHWWTGKRRSDGLCLVDLLLGPFIQRPSDPHNSAVCGARGVPICSRSNYGTSSWARLPWGALVQTLRLLFRIRYSLGAGLSRGISALFSLDALHLLLCRRTKDARTGFGKGKDSRQTECGSECLTDSPLKRQNLASGSS
jgi:hypothetical protein